MKKISLVIILFFMTINIVSVAQTTDWTNKYEKVITDYQGKNRIYRVKQNGLWGVLNSDQSVLIEPKYEDIRANPFIEDEKYAIVAKDFYWGLIDRNDKFIIPPQFEYIDMFDANGLAFVEKNRKWGLYDDQGKERLKPTYENMGSLKGYSKGKNGFYAIYNTKGKVGAIDKNLKRIISMRYDKIKPLGDYFILVGKEGKYDDYIWGVYSYLAKKVFVKPQFKKRDIELHGDFVFAYTYARPAVYNKKGKLLFPPKKYNGVKLVGNKFFEAEKNSGKGGWDAPKGEAVVLNEKGKVIYAEKSGVKNKKEYSQYLKLKKKSK
jgi:hypothetical protein